VTNITFIFETSPNKKPKEKSGGTWHIMSPRSERSGGNTSPVQTVEADVVLH